MRAAIRPTRRRFRFLFSDRGSGRAGRRWSCRDGATGSSPIAPGCRSAPPSLLARSLPVHLEIARAGLLRPAAGPIGDWIESASEKAQLDTIGTVYARARGCAPRSDRLAADFVFCLAIADRGAPAGDGHAAMELPGHRRSRRGAAARRLANGRNKGDCQPIALHKHCRGRVLFQRTAARQQWIVQRLYDDAVNAIVELRLLPVFQHVVDPTDVCSVADKNSAAAQLDLRPTAAD